MTRARRADDPQVTRGPGRPPKTAPARRLLARSPATSRMSTQPLPRPPSGYARVNPNGAIRISQRRAGRDERSRPTYPRRYWAANRPGGHSRTGLGDAGATAGVRRAGPGAPARAAPSAHAKGRRPREAMSMKGPPACAPRHGRPSPQPAAFPRRRARRRLIARERRRPPGYPTPGRLPLRFSAHRAGRPRFLTRAPSRSCDRVPAIAAAEAPRHVGVAAGPVRDPPGPPGRPYPTIHPPPRPGQRRGAPPRGPPPAGVGSVVNPASGRRRSRRAAPGGRPLRRARVSTGAAVRSKVGP